MCNRVCRVELPNMGMGTGCLVGPDLVLTCGHVVDSVVKSAGPSGTPIVPFNFALKGAEVQEGKVYRMHDEWRLASAPYDEGLGLNFVLMRLAASAGEETMSNRDKRGWITLKPAPDPNPGEAISILHHPRAGPMKMSLGALLRIEEQRLFHNALTEPGSSGAPCFSMGLDLIGLHEGRPNMNRKGKQAVPTSAVAERINDTHPGILRPYNQ